MWRWRRVATASQSGGKRESEVKVTSGCRRGAENVCCLSSLMQRIKTWKGTLRLRVYNESLLQQIGNSDHQW